MAYDTIQAKVERGVKLLDKVLPGWRKKIDPEILDIKCSSRCVLGQLSENFNNGLRLVGLRPYESYDFGFNVFPVSGRTNDEFIALNAEWHSVLCGNNN